jgi:hypothetical protein
MRMSQKRGAMVLVCLAVLFCVFILSLTGQIQNAAPILLAIIPLVVLTVSRFTEEAAGAALQPLALLLTGASRAPPLSR